MYIFVILVSRAKAMLRKWVSMWQRTVYPWKLGVWPWQRLWGQLRWERLRWACILTSSQYSQSSSLGFDDTLKGAANRRRRGFWITSFKRVFNIPALFQSSTHVAQVHSSATRVTVSRLPCYVMAGPTVVICQTRLNVVSIQCEKQWLSAGSIITHRRHMHGKEMLLKFKF